MTALEKVMDPGSGFGFEITAGELLTVSQVEGKQAADLLSFNRHRKGERLSMWMSRVINKAPNFTSPHVLVSHDGNDMWSIEEDTVGEHFGGGGYCNAALNTRWHGEPDPSCEANFLDALARYGLGHGDFDGDTCLNIFMKAPSDDWTLYPTPAAVGDFIAMRALMDQIVVVSNCPAIKTPTNWGAMKRLRLTVAQ